MAIPALIVHDPQHVSHLTVFDTAWQEGHQGKISGERLLLLVWLTVRQATQACIRGFIEGPPCCTSYLSQDNVSKNPIMCWFVSNACLPCFDLRVPALLVGMWQILEHSLSLQIFTCKLYSALGQVSQA